MKKITILLLISLMIFISGCSRQKETITLDETYTPVEITTPLEGNLSKKLSFTGEVSSKDLVIVNSTLLSVEEASKVLVNVGDYVKEDQVLAILDDKNTSTKIESSRLLYELAKSNYNSQYESYLIQLDNFKNIEILFNNGAISESEYKAAKLRASDNQVKLLKDQLNQAKFAYDNSLDDLNDLNLLAPVNGIISNINISKNNLVSSQNSITILNMENLEVKFYIPESKINIIKPGMNVTVEIPSIDINIDSEIDWINPQKDIRKNMYEGNLKIINNEQLIYPGMKSSVNIDLSNDETFLIPIDAVLYDDFNFVYVAENNKSIKIPVEIGDDNGEVIEIISGINEDSNIIIKGQNFVKENSIIKIVRRQ